MINLVYKDGEKLQQPTGKYVVSLLDGDMYEAGDFREMAACVCGLEYQDCEAEETAKMMRIETAKRIGLLLMTTLEEAMVASGRAESIEQLQADENHREPMIIYDEVIGKIPYSYTDDPVDYDIHGAPMLLRVECDETFILSLLQEKVISVHEHVDGQYIDYNSTHDINEEMKQQLQPYVEKAQTERVPNHKRLAKVTIDF